MIKLKIKGTEKAKIIRVLINVLNKHYQQLEVGYQKPSWSTTLDIQIKGKDEEAYASDLQSFCAELGWKMERQ